MSAPCDRVVERLALGEPLAELTAHVETCPACARLTALPGLLAGASATAPAQELGAGFAARITVGARGRLAARRRGRILGSTAAVAAAAALAALVMTQGAASGPTGPGAMRLAPTHEPIQARNPATDRTWPGDDVAPITDTGGDARLVRAVFDLSKLDRTLRPHRAWRSLERTFASTQKLLDQQQQGDR